MSVGRAASCLLNGASCLLNGASCLLNAGSTCLRTSFLWGELSWGDLSLGRIVRNRTVLRRTCNNPPAGFCMLLSLPGLRGPVESGNG